MDNSNLVGNASRIVGDAGTLGVGVYLSELLGSYAGGPGSTLSEYLHSTISYFGPAGLDFDKFTHLSSSAPDAISTLAIMAGGVATYLAVSRVDAYLKKRMGNGS